VGSARGHRGGVEGGDGRLAVGPEREMAGGRLARLEPEVREVLAHADGARRRLEHDPVAERRERRFVEGAAGRRIGDAELEVVDHANEITLRMPSCASISSKPLLTSSSVMRWERKASTSMSPAR